MATPKKHRRLAVAMVRIFPTTCVYRAELFIKRRQLQLQDPEVDKFEDARERTIRFLKLAFQDRHYRLYPRKSNRRNTHAKE